MDVLVSFDQQNQKPQSDAPKLACWALSASLESTVRSVRSVRDFKAF